MNVVCVGGGYVGSVTAVAFASLGYKTTIIDIDHNKVELINRGQSPIYEKGLEELIKKLIGNSLFATTEFSCIKEADFVFIGVETPTAIDGSADLKYIKSAAKSIGENIDRSRFTIIVNKSTVPAGTTEVVSSIIAKTSGLTPEEDFAVASNPEFLREGSALDDVFFPERIVVGTTHPVAKQKLKELYKPIITRDCYHEKASESSPVYFETDPRTAELIKYASNAFLAVKISYINEVAKLCEGLGANGLDVAKGMGLDSRIGNKFLEISCGWQGSCFPKDTSEFYLTSKRYHSELTIVKAAIDANIEAHNYIVKKIINSLGCLNGKTIGVLGLTFKPDTDDARRTQAQFIIPQLLNLGANVQVFDPRGMEMFRKYNPGLEIAYCKRPEDVAQNGHCILLLTHWQEFKNLNWQEIFNTVNRPYILDTRNFLPKKELVDMGFYYQGLGMVDKI